MRIPFDIKYKDNILSGRARVETKHGQEVTILCFNAKSTDRNDDIIGLVTCSDGVTQNVQRYYSNGHLIADSSRRGDKDLYVVFPDPPLTDFEKELVNYANEYINNSEDVTLNEQTRKYSKNLLNLAIKEMDLPQWKKAEYDIYDDSICYLVKYTHDGGDHQDWDEIIPTNRVKEGEMYLEIDDKMLNLPIETNK